MGGLLDIGIMVRVFTNGLGDLGSIPGWVIPKTQKMVLDATLLNTQHYKVLIKGQMEQSRERSSTLPYRKGSLRVTFSYGCHLYLLMLLNIGIKIFLMFLKNFWQIVSFTTNIISSMQHNVKFKIEYSWVQIHSFLSPRLVALPRLKEPTLPYYLPIASSGGKILAPREM